MKNKITVLLLAILLISITSCKKDDDLNSNPVITLKTGGNYTVDNQLVPLGGKILFGVKATNGGAIITYLKIQRIADGNVITEKDQGVYLKDSLDMDFIFNKSTATQEIWRFLVMNSNRDSAVTTLTINRGTGSSYGEIYYYPSLKIGLQQNTTFPNYVDLHNGNLYTKTNVTGHEVDIDLVGFFYITGGKNSPTLCCPGYTGSSSVTAADRYPEIEPWTTKHLTLYDYFSSDNNLVNISAFNDAEDDSLLVTSYKPEKVSGLCKYCISGRIIPFKTEDGKYGLVHVLHADTTSTGYMELEIKVQI